MKYSDSQTLAGIRIARRTCEDRFLGLTPRLSDSVGLSWSLKIVFLTSFWVMLVLWVRDHTWRTTDKIE